MTGIPLPTPAHATINQASDALCRNTTLRQDTALLADILFTCDLCWHIDQSCLTGDNLDEGVQRLPATT